LIKSSRNNFDFRKLLRINYSPKYRHNKSLPNIRFLLGKGSQPENSNIEKKIQEEIDEHGDIIIGNFIDSYNNLPQKVTKNHLIV
jgi:hypothetical protein